MLNQGVLQMKRPLITITLGLLLTGCANNEIAANNPQQVKEVPTEEKLIESEIVKNQGEKKVEAAEIKMPQSNNEAEKVGSITEDATNDKDVPHDKKVTNVITNPDDILVLVNKQNSLPEDYEPSDLVAPNIPLSFDEDLPKRYVRREAAAALEQLFAAAKAENIELLGASGYRSYDRQEAIFASNVAQKGEEAARKVSAVAGQSEHQTGLAMDVTSKYVGFDLIEEFGETKEGIWLKENAHKYGFIIRYPKGKEAITGYSYEPWHIRFVGKDVAAAIYQNGYTFEEYLSKN